MSFPYQGKTRFEGPEPSLQELAAAQSGVEGLLLGMVAPDHSVSLIARFDGDLSGHLGGQGQGSGALRFDPGPFQDSMSVLLEGQGENLLPNPSLETDLAGWSAADPSLELSRDPSVACREGGLFSDASLRLQGTGKPGVGQVQTSVAVNPAADYSGSVYLHSEGNVQARLELAFTGGETVAFVGRRPRRPGPGPASFWRTRTRGTTPPASSASTSLVRRRPSPLVPGCPAWLPQPRPWSTTP